MPANQGAAFLDLLRQVAPGRLFFPQVRLEGAEFVAPCFNREDIATNSGEGKARGPAIIVDQPKWRSFPLGRVFRAPEQEAREQLMPVGNQVDFNVDPVSNEALGGEAAAVDGGDDRLDRDSRRLRGHPDSRWDRENRLRIRHIQHVNVPRGECGDVIRRDCRAFENTAAEPAPGRWDASAVVAV